MVSSLFVEWVESINEMMKAKGRKICLIIDNCPAHPQIEPLSNVVLQFLPPNTTSVAQPCDQGIINAFKKKYRAKVLLKLIASLDEGKPFTLNIHQSIIMARDAWREVTQVTIANCFRHCGFHTEFQEQEVITEPVAEPKLDRLYSLLPDLPHEV